MPVFSIINPDGKIPVTPVKLNPEKVDIPVRIQLISTPVLTKAGLENKLTANSFT